MQNGTWNDGTSEDKKQIINLYDKDGNPAENGTGKITIPQVGNKPAEGYSKGSWNAEIPEVVSNKDNEKLSTEPFFSRNSHSLPFSSI